MGNSTSQPSALQQCLMTLGNGSTDFAGFPADPLYQSAWVRRYNLNIAVSPAAVVRPRTVEEVAGAVRCAAANDVKVQAKSGGHSYGNYGLGGRDGALAIDLTNLRHFSMDNTTWRATIGAGTRLRSVSDQLHNAGGRAIAHGACPGIGFGGHATIGGLGQSSRMWGSSLDHVVEMEVVTADGNIRRANKSQNADLFWALQGAASGFGVVTEFVVETHPEPPSVVQYEYASNLGSLADIASMYSAWQDLVADPTLDRRFGSIFIVEPLGAVISGTFYGTEAEFNASGIPDRLPKGSGNQMMLSDWLASLAHNAEQESLWLASIPNPFYSKSLGFRREDLLTKEGAANLFRWIDGQRLGPVLWFIIFDASGGAVADVPANATAFAHRDKLLYYQSYAVGFPLAPQTKAFVTNFHEQLLALSPDAYGTYPGYVDPELPDAQCHYWGANLPALQRIKQAWDPTDLFRNPQSVRLPG